MNKMYFIKKKTEKVRYRIVALILKQLTPVLYEKINFNTFVGKRVFQPKTDNVPSIIRPTIKYIKENFNEKLIIGVEIGVERGRNSKNILKELNIEKLYLIDAWDNYKGIDGIWLNMDGNYEYVLSILGNDKRVEIIKNHSNVVVNDFKNNSLDFVYIDANHKYEYAYQDINLWFPKVKEGGIIGGHDVCLPAVLNAVTEFCSNKNIKFQTEIPDWYFIKQ